MNVYDLTISQFVRVLGQVHRWLDKAEAHAAAKKFDVNTLLTARIAPDMFPLVRQIQTISDTTKGTAARLSGTQPPSFPDEEKTVAELRARIDKTLEYLKTITPEQLAGAAERTITLPWMPGKGLSGADFLIRFALPNFYFHATTTYAILRHNGVDVGKMDFLGELPFKDL